MSITQGEPSQFDKKRTKSNRLEDVNLLLRHINQSRLDLTELNSISVSRAQDDC